MAGRYQLAHLNIARMKYAYENPEMQDFLDLLDPVNATADASPGFVWRLQEEGDSAQDLIWDDPGWLINISVWEDVDSLKDFVRSHLHAEVMKRRREWFTPTTEAYTVLWWVPAGHRPDVAEAQARLEKLRADGPTPGAFNFARTFPPPQLLID